MDSRLARLCDADDVGIDSCSSHSGAGTGALNDQGLGHVTLSSESANVVCVLGPGKGVSVGVLGEGDGSLLGLDVDDAHEAQHHTLHQGSSCKRRLDLNPKP